MNPHQKPQEDVVEAMAEAMYVAHLKRNKPWAVESLFHKDRWRASTKAALALLPTYEAGRRDMREAAGKVAFLAVVGLRRQEQRIDSIAELLRLINGGANFASIRALTTEPLGGEG